MTWLLLILFMVLSFMLSGLESAVMAVSRVRVRHAASAGDRRARNLLPLLEDRDALIGCITVANHLTNLAAFLLIAFPVIHHASLWGYVLAFTLALPVFLIGLEVMPKKIFRSYPFRSMRSVSPLVHFVGLARPLFRVVAGRRTADPTAAPSEARQTRGREDLKALAQQLATQHQLSANATHLIERVLDYKKLRTGDVMQPLARSIALAAEIPLSTALIVAREQNCTLLPVLGDSGSFIGLLDTTELPAIIPPDRLVRHHMRTLDVISASLPALHALQRMRKSGRRLAIVVDERQQPLGLITEERLLEPLMH
ncbi:CNNM domain-containing protein [Prosthecobacter sp.]|uniref:CNNM domain-containing protein n=1 Tax=Prosthecobacter sp. TaxID=1965333 RepID=UPI002488E58B|nr:CNNM domain-containing protein [Prosthecobacter sp.]MDI1312643.1 CNNM domain-containing protein [Prosthecobacter sp.]